MIDYLSALKRELLHKAGIFFIVFTLLSNVFLLIIIWSLSPVEIFIRELIFIIFYIISFVILRRVIGKFLHEKLGSQESISRAIFKNTRTILNNISHELRTPLNAILGFSSSLYETEENIERKEALRAVKDNGDRLFSMAKKLLDFSTIETGQYLIENEYIHNDSLLTNLENKFRREVEDKGLALKIINNIPLDYGLWVDFNALFEILEMLVENAVKFSEKGTITVTSSYREGILKYAIQDMGPGVPKEKKKRIFQLYQQGNSEMDRTYEGLGLGLSIAEKLTHLLGGTITLSDNIDRGTCFNVIIKTEIREFPVDIVSNDTDFLPDLLTNEERKIIRDSAYKFSEYIKVFDPGKIRLIAEELSVENIKFRGLADRVIRTADTFNESEFSLIFEEMMKGTTDEN